MFVVGKLEDIDEGFEDQKEPSRKSGQQYTPRVLNNSRSKELTTKSSKHLDMAKETSRLVE